MSPGTAFREIGKGSNLYPTVGLKKAGEHVRVNFGQTPFVFDIEGMMTVSHHFLSTSALGLEQANDGIFLATSRVCFEFWGLWTVANMVGAQAEKERLQSEISETSTASLAPPMNETELIQALVSHGFNHLGIWRDLTRDRFCNFFSMTATWRQQEPSRRRSTQKSRRSASTPTLQLRVSTLRTMSMQTSVNVRGPTELYRHH